jgi:hypothetical protein
MQITMGMLKGEVDFCPVPVMTKDGRLISVETRVVAGTWNGQPAFFGVTKDISRLKRSVFRLGAVGLKTTLH